MAAPAVAVSVKQTRTGGRLVRALPLALWLGTSLGLTLWVAGAKLADLLLPIGTDQGLFSLIGASILRGEVPYRDVWDNKPPGLYFAYAAVLAWFPGHAVECTPPFLSVGPERVGLSCGHVGVMALDLLLTAGVGLAVFAAGRLVLRSWKQGALASSLFLVFAVQEPLTHGGARPELLLLLPEALAYLLLWHYLAKGHPAWLTSAGFCLGVAFLAKQTAVALGASMLVVLALRLHSNSSTSRFSALARGMVWLGAGAALAILPVAAYFWASGSLGELLYATIGFNLEYARSPEENFLVRALSGSWTVFRDSQALLWTLALVGLALVIPQARTGQSARLLCLWAAGDVLALSLGGGRFFRYYYLQLVPAFALLGARGLWELWERLGPRGQAGAPGARALASRLWLLASLAAILSLSTPVQAQVLLRTLHERVLHWVPGEAEQAARAIRRTPPGPILVWGEASQVYVLTDRRPASRFVHAVAVSDRWARSVTTDARREELIRQVTGRQPVAIAIDPWTSREDPSGALRLNLSSFQQLRSALESHYTRSPLDAGSFELYVRGP